MKRAVSLLTLFPAAVVLLIMVLFSGCTTPQGAVQQDESIRIGVLLPLTGPFSGYGASSLNSIQLHFDEVNRGGGIGGKPVALFVEDAAADAETAANRAKFLINRIGVGAIIGPLTSDASIATGEVCQQKGVPMICIAATLKAVTEVGDFVFRAALIEDYQIYILAKFALENLNSERAAAVSFTDVSFAEGFTQVFEEQYRELGGREVLEIQVQPDDPNLQEKVDRIKDFGPDVLFIPSGPARASELVSKVREGGIDAVLLGLDLWLKMEEYLDLYDGGYFIDHYSPETYEQRSHRFVEAYQERYGPMPDSITALAYESAVILAVAIREAFSADPVTLRNALAEIDTETIIGRFRFDENRNPVKPAIIKQIKDGEIRYTVSVYPEVVDEEEVYEQIRAAAAASGSGEIPVVAVLDLALSNVAPEDAAIIVDLIGSAIANTNAFRTLERGKRDKMLEEMEYSRSDMVDEQYQIAIGRQLAADRIVTGSLGILADRFILNIKLIDVESGETLSAAYKVHKSMNELLDHTDRLAIDLVSRTVK